MEINGKKYVFRFKYKALKEFLIKTGITLSDLGNETTMTLYAGEMLFYGLKSGAEFAKEKFDLTLDDVINWIDEDSGNLAKAMEALNTDMPDNTGE
jgi:hypothetical protein